MAGSVWTIDPTADDATQTQLVIVDNATYFLLEEDCPPPDLNPVFASSVDTEGELLVENNFHNRTVTLKLRIVGSSAANLQATLQGLQQKLGKLNREGGSLGLNTPAGTNVFFDVVNATYTPDLGRAYVSRNRSDCTLVFSCRPFGRGAPSTLTTHTEATLPALVFTESSIAGDVPGLGRLVVTEGQAQNQAWVRWGVQSRFYDPAATAGLFYEAESRTPLGSAATAIGTATPSGSGNNVVRSGALTTTLAAVLSTQTSGAGAQLSHVGDFQVYARCMSRSGNTGTVSYALQWAVGEFINPTTNASVTPPIANGLWQLLDLGQVHIPKAVQGTQVWEGRVLAESTVAGDTIDIDYVLLVPISEGAGVVSAPTTTVAPSVIGGSDTFKTSAAALNGIAADIGGTWATSGAVTDFTEDASNKRVTRTVGTDLVNAGRFAVLGTTTYTGQVAQIYLSKTTTGTSTGGLLLRWTDANNHLRVVVTIASSSASVNVVKRVTGTDTTLYSAGPITLPPITLAAYVDAAGTVSIGWTSGPSTPALSAVTQDAALATGGTLASGKAGFYDESQIAGIRLYQNFLAYAYTGDAALFASRQLEVRWNTVIRQDAGGTLWRQPTKYEGDYLLVSPAGKEARSVRFVVKACRNDPSTGQDSAIDDISAQLVYTPRYLIIPN